MEEGKQKVIFMCCDDCHCPTVTVGKEGVVITDDHDGRVRLTHREFSLFKGKVKKGEL